MFPTNLFSALFQRKLNFRKKETGNARKLATKCKNPFYLIKLDLNKNNN